MRSLPGRPALLPALPVRDRLLEAPGGVSHFPGQIGHGNHGMSFAHVLSGLGINPRLITQLWELRIWCHTRGQVLAVHVPEGATQYPVVGFPEIVRRYPRAPFPVVSEDRLSTPIRCAMRPIGYAAHPHGRRPAGRRQGDDEAGRPRSLATC